MKKIITLGMFLLLSLFALAGCSGPQSSQMSNELQFSLKDISSLTISYDEEDITFYESDSNKLIVKEYMTKSENSYYAKVTESKNNLKISEGGKPFFKNGFSRYIEVFLPKSFHENLTVTSTNGTIDLSEISLELSMLRIDNTSGNIKLKQTTASDIHLSSSSGTLELGKLEAKQINLETTSGNINCVELDGNVTYTSTSGNTDIESASGAGSYTANNSGRLNVKYTEVNGDLSFFNKNDDVNLTLPEDLEFEFEATTKNGSVSTTFQQDVTVNDRTSSGVIGKDPTVTIKVETKNGNIEVIQ